MQAWEQFLRLQERELGVGTVKKWLSSLKVLRFDAGNLYLEAKDSFQAMWFDEHARVPALHYINSSSNRKVKIHLSIAQPNPPPKEDKNNKRSKIAPLTSSFELTFDALDPLCTFDKFIPIEKNHLPYKLLCELISSNQPHVAFNPIYLHGMSGTGKTHLLMALAQEFYKKGLKVIYARAETFTDHMVNAMRSGQMSQFRQGYRNIDILLLDDVHLFSRKSATQEELFHTFNALHMSGKQIILAANCAPGEMQFIEPRLISRFEWGIVLPLEPFNSEELAEVLRHKATALKFPIPNNISEFLLQTFTSHTKSLIRALEALILRSHLDNRQSTSVLDVARAKQLLNDLIIAEEKTTVTPTKIIQSVAEYYGIRSEDILGKAQSRDCALPRQVAMHLCRTHLKLPFTKIGDIFSRDHSTVMSNVRQIQQAIDADDKEIANASNTILRKLQP